MTLSALQGPNWDQTVIESVGPWLKSNICTGVGSTPQYNTTGDQPGAAAQLESPSVVATPPPIRLPLRKIWATVNKSRPKMTQIDISTLKPGQVIIEMRFFFFFLQWNEVI